MHVEESEWARLRELRERFLAPQGAGPDYWSDRRLCELYDGTFGRRIAWKWRAVWSELEARGRMPEARTILDWGCGSGIAAREHARAAGPRAGAARYFLFDRSRDAVAFAADALGREAPGTTVETRLPGPGETPGETPGEIVDLLLSSHVLGELDGAGRAALAAEARRARAVIFVEPGLRTVSRDLGRLRDELLLEPGPGGLPREVLGPCTHSEACGLFAAGRERDWCHFFAAPDPEVFTTAAWREFSRRLSIDLRSVPYSYVALGSGAEGLSQAPASGGELQLRILGRPRLEKGQAKLDACDASGVRVLRMLERDDRAFVKQLAEPSGLARAFHAAVDGDRIRSIH